MPVVYRIKHIPTGMYFCPSREVKVKLDGDSSYYEKSGRHIKSNLSKTGKSYLKKPTIKQIGSHYYTHLITGVRQLSNGMGNYAMLPVLPNEWVIEEIE
jgi:hypothetical protein